MASLKERSAATVARLRDKVPALDHTVRMVQHYVAVHGSAQAGAVTFFGFLSVFPILALAFFVIGLLSHVYPGIRVPMVQAIDDLMPGVFGTGPGQIDLDVVESSARTAGLVGLLGLVYSGLGWLSGMRQALEVMFVVPRQEFPNFLLGKLRDLGALLLIGLTLLVSVALTSAVTGFSGAILTAMGVNPDSVVPAVLLNLLGRVLAVAASTVLLLTMFQLLLTDPHVPPGALVRGALLGAVGFEALKLVANLLLAQTRGSPAFQAFGVALIVVVWINYFSRLVMLSAAWAYSSPLALERRAAEAIRAPGAVLAGAPTVGGAFPPTPGQPDRPRWQVAASAAAVAAVLGWLARGTRS